MPIDYSKLRNLTARELISAISRDGFYLRSQREATSDIITPMEEKSLFPFMVRATRFLRKH